MNAGAVSHWFKIVRREKLGRSPVEVLLWNGMAFDLRMRWDWYFRYRAALLQVKYPRHVVDVTWGNEQATGNILERSIANSISSKKATITKHTNKLNDYIAEFDRYKAGYLQIFPIEEQMEYQRYIASIELASAKINRLKKELEELQPTI